MTILLFILGVFDKNTTGEGLAFNVVAGVALDAFTLALLSFMK